jgi:malate dehydrogenase (oxaloacetate-decarboxylating)
VIFGSGSAGIGVAEQLRDALITEGLPPREAASRLWCLDRHGLLTGDTAEMREFQAPYARSAAEVDGWTRDPALGGIALKEVVERVRPTVLIGTSGRADAFTEPVVRRMAAAVKRPIILPMSNPTTLAEAVPADLLAWTDGRALIATGSPFEPVVYQGTTYTIGQANNALVFPGIGLGSIVAWASRITKGMVTAAARAVAGLAEASAPGTAILPGVEELAETSHAVAVAVVRAAVGDGVARAALPDDQIEAAVRAAAWRPEYRPIRAV